MGDKELFHLMLSKEIFAEIVLLKYQMNLENGEDVIKVLIKEHYQKLQEERLYFLRGII